MKVEQFFEKFDQLTDVPGAIAKMRDLVLQAAVRGRLVAQNPLDGDADVLLEQIERVRKENNNPKLSSTSDMSQLSNIGGWYDIPNSWRWVPLKALGRIVGGGTPRSDNPKFFAAEGVPWLTPADLNGFKEKRIVKGRRCLTKAGLESSSAQLLPVGTVLFSSRAPIGYVAIAGTELATNQGFKSCVPYIEEVNEFLYYFLLSAATRIDQEASGTTFREVSGKTVGMIPVSLPPLAEQRRIVAKVDELMALCDRLEAQQKEREMRHAALTRAAVARFNEAPTPANLDLLFHKSYSIPPADLRKTILSSAIRGCLLKSSIRVAGWRKVALKDICLQITDGEHATPQRTSEGIPLATAKNVRDGFLDLSNTDWVSLETAEKCWRRCKPRHNDILMVCVGATTGRVCLAQKPADMVLVRSVALIRPNTDIVLPSYLELFLRSPEGQSQVWNKVKQSAQPCLYLGRINSFEISLPGLAEQQQIIIKVNQLTALVDQLEMQITMSQSKAQKLLDALIHELLHPSDSDKVIVSSGREQDHIASRSVIGCYTIRHLAQNPNFGRTMLMKVFYLSEAHAGISQDWQPMRQAAGPYDSAIEDFESLGVHSGWFTVKRKTLNNGHEMIEYQGNSGLAAKVAEASAALGRKKAEFDRLLGLFQDKTTEEAEIIATLFAAWNDLLIDGKSPSDDEIIREVRENWHSSKERFTPALLTKWLNWMRQQKLVPKGQGPRTIQQLSLVLN